MKYQHLAVIFCLIIVPISMVIGLFTSNMIKVSDTQTAYTTLLYNSTYDAIRAYQINTANNNYSSERTSRIRDIQASVNSFFSSMANGLSSSGYTKNELNNYIPAILYNLYDGFYIYGTYTNYAELQDKQYDMGYGEIQIKKAPVFMNDDNLRSNDKQRGLKAFNYYTCKYSVNNQYNIVVNYTLDNYISVYAEYLGDDGGWKYEALSGYYIDPRKVANIDSNNHIVILSDGSVIGPEKLGEYVATVDTHYEQDNTFDKIYRDIRYYNYIIYNNQKYYFDDSVMNGNSEYGTVQPEIRTVGNRDNNFSFNNTYTGIPIFRLENNKRVYVSNYEMAKLYASIKGMPIPVDEKNFFRNNNINLASFFAHKDSEFVDLNAYYYYVNAKAFSERAHNILKRIDIGDNYRNIESEPFKREYNVDIDKTGLKSTDIHQKASLQTTRIFDYEQNGNDPELSSSSFDAHRIDVIVANIQNALVNEVKNFDEYMSKSYKYQMPAITEGDWNVLANNSTMLAFMEGMPIGNYKFFSNYAIVNNTKTIEFINKEAIYVQPNYQNNEGWNSAALATQASHNGDYNPNNAMILRYQNLDNKLVYYDPRSRLFNEESKRKKNENVNYKVICYRIIDYDRDSITLSKEDVNAVVGNDPNDMQLTKYFYYQPGIASYDSVVSRNNLYGKNSEYAIDMLIKGGITDDGVIINPDIRIAYLTALARFKASTKKLSAEKRYQINEQVSFVKSNI